MATAVLEARREGLDTAVRLVTPERITFRYPLAGPFRRAAAYLVDLVILLCLCLVGLVLSLLFSLGSAAGFGIFLVALFGLRFGYGALCEGLLNGQTPGKRAFRLRVVSVEGVPIDGSQAFLRNLLWCLDGALPFAYMPALACMIVSPRFQRLGDLAARTMVIVEDRPRRGGVRQINDDAVKPLLAILPASIAAGPELARALSDYAELRERITTAHREEMADPLARPARVKYGLPDDARADAVVSALYHRVFLEG